MSEQRPLDIKWIIIGFGILGGLCWLLPLAIAEPLVPPLVESMGLTWGLIVFALIIAFGAFFGGGVLVAYFSPGDTSKEPAIAALLAVAFNTFMNLRAVEYQVDGGFLLGAAITAAVAFGFAMAGGKVGERLQGDTTDKMRERGDLRG